MPEIPRVGWASSMESRHIRQTVLPQTLSVSTQRDQRAVERSIR